MRDFIESLLAYYILSCVITFVIALYISCIIITSLCSLLTLGKNPVSPIKFHRYFVKEVKSVI